MKVRRDENGVHLFDRESGLNILFDEVHVPEIERNWAPRFVSIALTNACDLRCRFCYAPKHGASLDVDDVVAWSLDLDKAGCLGLGFGGGEPILHPNFQSICQQVSTHTRLAVSFTTHGHRLTPSLADELVGFVHFMRISMDGTYSTYRRIRNRDFSELLTKLELAAQIAPFGVNYVVNAATIADLDEAAAIAFDRGAQEMLLLPERSVKGIGGIDVNTKIKLREWINRNSQYRLTIADSPPLEGIPIANPFRLASGLNGYAHITASGYLQESSYSTQGVRLTRDIKLAFESLSSRIGGAA